MRHNALSSLLRLLSTAACTCTCTCTRMDNLASLSIPVSKRIDRHRLTFSKIVITSFTYWNRLAMADLEYRILWYGITELLYLEL